MFLLSDVKQARVYQEANQEGRQEGEVRLVLRLLSKRVGKIGAPQSGSLRDRSVEMINSLTLEQLDDLGDALLDFGTIADLDNWLKSYVKK
jgi:predicted transposase YdaD